ncbi:hypothetical protein JCM31447_14670 [Fluviispira sanaruensis]|uniref:Uncharacterized protein n=1 Tax=Fluviispira sanaruensis TaxID=2493639 RepID=A0A4P2VLZ7_FLUSA|nr:hypothetical protein JCM31447_14670 [Fluviispira sanaruensis]
MMIYAPLEPFEVKTKLTDDLCTTRPVEVKTKTTDNFYASMHFKTLSQGNLQRGTLNVIKHNVL